MSPAHLVIRPKPAFAAHHRPKGPSKFSFFETKLSYTTEHITLPLGYRNPAPHSNGAPFHLKSEKGGSLEVEAQNNDKSLNRLSDTLTSVSSTCPLDTSRSMTE